MWRSLLRSPLRLLLIFAILVLLFLSLAPKLVVADLVLEPGYTVSTLLDCNKPLRLSSAAAASVHPFSILSRPSARDLILLDSIGSAFYSLPVPVTEDVEVALLAGKGAEGFNDGDAAAAMFKQPRSFTIDGKGNVYVADRRNFAIRKISSSGLTTTIAGGYSQKMGHIDGPAQNATFSNDFDLVYITKLCALLISDRANRLIRQINLKPTDCAHESQSGLGVAHVSIIAVLCMLLGLVIGFVCRPFFGSREVSINHFISKMQKHYRANLGRLMSKTYYDVRSAVANSTPLFLVIRLIKSSLCYMYIVYRNLSLEKRFQCREHVSPMDSDASSNRDMMKSHVVDDQQRDLISFDEHIDVLQVSTPEQIFDDQQRDLISFDEHIDVLEVSTPEQETETDDVSEIGLCKIESMINANFSDFADVTNQDGLVRRRSSRIEKL